MHTKILVVEDDAIQRSLLTHLLASQGHVVEAAADGLAALRRLRRHRFDIVLLDYALPDIDGRAAAQLISGLAPDSCRPQLIGLTATPEAMRDRVAEAAGLFSQVLAKPCSPAALLAAVADAQSRFPQPRPPALPPARPFEGHGSLPPLRPGGPASPAPGRPAPADPAPAGPASTSPASASPASASPAPAGALAVATPAAQAPRVLLVDDDATVLSIVEAVLVSHGFAVDTAADGLAAFEKIARTRYQVVVLDFRMPNVDGHAAARLAFELLSGADRPRLVALTANPDDLRGREAGAPSLFDDIVTKSADLGTLVEVVRRSADYGRRRAPLAPLGMADIARLAKLLEPRT